VSAPETPRGPEKDTRCSPSFPEGARLSSRLHHIGIVVVDLPAAAAQYEKEFGYQIVPSAHGHDPVQTIYFQFLRPSTGGPYLELLAPDGPASRVVGTFKRGNALHHLCYATPNLEDDCARLGRAGMVLVHEPVAAVAFPGRRIAWMMGPERVLTELLEEGEDAWERTPIPPMS
jgi:catechol 2,3-dioxygenase-like lactoylglutathione lyase family enzyme